MEETKQPAVDIDSIALDTATKIMSIDPGKEWASGQLLAQVQCIMRDALEYYRPSKADTYGMKDAELDALRTELDNVKARFKSTANLMILHRDKACENGRRAYELENELTNVKAALATAEKMLAERDDTGAVQIGMDMASGPDTSYLIFAHSDGTVNVMKPPLDPLPDIVNGIYKHAQTIVEDGLAVDMERKTILDNVAKLPPVDTTPYGIERRKVQWPEPGKVPFDLERRYDPMNMKNREGPLKLREDDGKDTPRRRKTDRQSED